MGIPLIGLTDGALHLNTAETLRAALGGLRTPAATYLTWFPVPVPNLLSEIALAVLLVVFSPEWAERILILGVVAAFPLAMLYAVRGVSRDADWLALFALPLTFNFSLNYGFYNFAYSLALFLVVAGFALRLPELPRVRDLVVLGLLLVATYLTHVVGFVEALLFVFILFGWRWIHADRRHAGRELQALVVAFALGGAALGLFAVETGSVTPHSYGNKPQEIAETLALSLGVLTFSLWEIVLTTCLSVVLLILLVLAVRRRRPVLAPRNGDGLLIYAIVSFLAVAAAPSSIESGGSYITQRLALFPALGLVLWLGSQRLPGRAIAAAGGVFLAVAVGLAVVRMPANRQVARAVDDIMTAAPCIAERATMLQADLHLPRLDNASWRSNPLQHESSRLAAETDGLDLGNISFSVPYYLLRFVDRLDPTRWIPTPPGAMETVPPSFGLAKYEQKTGGRVDYLIVTGHSRATPDVLASPKWRNLRAELGTLYHLVYRSPARWVEIWERRVPEVEARGAARRQATGCQVFHGTAP